MGSISHFACTTCPAAWDVNGSGDIDYNMTAAHLTLVCAACHQIADARVRVPRAAMYTHRVADLRRLPACAACGSDQVRVWQEGDPCPKCQGPVLRDPNSIILCD